MAEHDSIGRKRVFPVGIRHLVYLRFRELVFFFFFLNLGPLGPALGNTGNLEVLPGTGFGSQVV